MIFFLVVEYHLVHGSPSLTTEVSSQAWNHFVLLLKLQIHQKINVLDDFLGDLVCNIPQMLHS